MHPVHGPTQTINTNDLIALNIGRDCNTLCTVVDVGQDIQVVADTQMNNKMLLMPSDFYSVPRQAALEYYRDHPIQDHVQSLPSSKKTFLAVEGERVWTSTKALAELEEILVGELKWAKRHVGKSNHRIVVH